ncbi:MAG: dihydropteroate synthase [Pseudomonadota bacterium]|jgi:dihydropteroate synthase
MVLARPVSLVRPQELGPGLARAGRVGPCASLEQAVLLLSGLEAPERAWLLGACGGTGVSAVPGHPSLRPDTALTAGSVEAHRALAGRARDAGHPGLASALERAVDSGRGPPGLTLGGRPFQWGGRTRIMGVVNVTPDSFSDGGRCLDEGAAVAHGEALAEAGADLLDVGGESTRPGAARVPVEEELRRVVPVVRRLAGAGHLVSVDTSRHEVARAALAAGAVMVNDVSGFTWDPALPQVVAEAGAACCLMHVQGTPQTMQRAPVYDDVVEEVLAHLSRSVALAERAGIPPERVWVDPGIGFGKTAAHNLLLLRRLSELRVLGRALLVGTSRKSFLGALVGGKPPAERLWATLGSVAAVAARGDADVVRVHDVAETKDALAVADALRLAGDGGALYAVPVDVPSDRS